MHIWSYGDLMLVWVWLIGDSWVDRFMQNDAGAGNNGGVGGDDGQQDHGDDDVAADDVDADDDADDNDNNENNAAGQGWRCGMCTLAFCVYFRFWHWCNIL